MIQLSQVSARYPGSDQIILNEIDFTLDKGVFGVIEGATGSGKTTLVKLLTCQLDLIAGSAVVGSYDFSTLHGSKRAKYLRSIGLVSRDFRLLEDKTIEENIRIAIEILPSQAKYDGEARIGRVIERYGLAPHRHLFPRQLSHGEQQRVAMARAVVREPLILIADEPTTQFDRTSAETIRHALYAEHARGMTVLVLTSNGDEYKTLPAKKAVLQNGRLLSKEVASIQVPME